MPFLMSLPGSLLFVFLLIGLPPATTDEFSEDLVQFLEQNGRKTDWQHLRDVSHYFIETRTTSGEVRWLTGSLETTDGERFEDVSIKFNTLDNAVYLRHRKGLYKLPGSVLQRFQLIYNGAPMFFEKGFGMQSEQRMEFLASCGIADAFDRLLAFGNREAFDLISVSTALADKQEFQIRLALKTSGTKTIYELQSHMMASPCLKQVALLSEVPDVDEARFMQILSENNGVQLLKLHQNRSATTESVSLTKHSATHAFTDARYFIADRNGQMVEIKKVRSTVKRALERLDLMTVKELPSVGSEKKLRRWFEAARILVKGSGSPQSGL